MKCLNKYNFFFFLFLFSSVLTKGQESFKVRKQGELVFYQKGIKRETIDAREGTLFYLRVPAELQPKVLIHIDNAQLISINDTIFKLRFVRGVKYECAYVLNDESDKTKQKREYKVMINGSSDFEKNKIRITFVDDERKETLLENIFQYKE